MVIMVVEERRGVKDEAITGIGAEVRRGDLSLMGIYSKTG